MARTKTARRTDKDGKLPPLAPHRPPDTRWGMAAEMFAERFTLPLHPRRPGSYYGG